MKLEDKHIVVAVSGGIAAYKTAFLVRELRRLGAQVQVIMSTAATKFISPLTFRSLSSRPVETSLFDDSRSNAMRHIELARWADLLIVAPASANTLAKMALGTADNLITAFYLASSAPTVVAPAMNRQMWQHPAQQHNLNVLKHHGVKVWGPATGPQACGEFGEGRMLEPDEIAERIVNLFSERTLSGHKVIVTAGPTHEAIDAVRFIGNHSSGKMGFSIAQAANDLGARVILISGPVSLATPYRVERCKVTTARQMRDAVLRNLPGTDILVACAAVSDYQPAEPVAHKIKKDRDTMALNLIKTPDILEEVSRLPAPPFLVGFAAETEAPAARAKSKLLQKNLDVVVANQIGPRADHNFGSDTNEVDVFWRGGGRHFDSMPKTRLGRKLMVLLAELFAIRNRADEASRTA